MTSSSFIFPLFCFISNHIFMCGGSRIRNDNSSFLIREEFEFCHSNGVNNPRDNGYSYVNKPLNSQDIKTSESNESSALAIFLSLESRLSRLESLIIDRRDIVEDYLSLFVEKQPIIGIFNHHIVKSLRSRRLLPSTDILCYFNIFTERCEPHCVCSWQYRIGDFHPSRSCRFRPQYFGINFDELQRCTFLHFTPMTTYLNSQIPLHCGNHDTGIIPGPVYRSLLWTAQKLSSFVEHFAPCISYGLKELGSDDVRPSSLVSELIEAYILDRS